MGVITWIIVGAIAGFLAKLVNPGTEDETSGFLGTMLLGVVGAVIGGWAWNLFLARPGAAETGAAGVLVALVGSAIVIGLLRLFDRRESGY